MILDVVKDFRNLDVLEEKLFNILNNTYFFNNPFFDYIPLLRQNSKIVPFKHTYNYSPQTVSIEFYNTKKLYPIILVVNNCHTIFEFTSEKYSFLYVPNVDIIKKIILSFHL